MARAPTLRLRQTIADVPGSVISGDLDTTVGTAIGDVETDGLGAMAITSFTTGGSTVNTNGANSTLDSLGANILLSGFGTATLTGFVDVLGGSPGAYDVGTDKLIFTLTLQPGTDTYKFNLNNVIDNGSGVS